MDKGNEILVILDREDGIYRLEFPDEADRALACYKLANSAVKNGMNPKFTHEDVGYVRDLFLGTTLKHLHGFWAVPGEDAIRFVFKESCRSNPEQDVVVILKTKDEKGTQFIIES